MQRLTPRCVKGGCHAATRAIRTTRAVAALLTLCWVAPQPMRALNFQLQSVVVEEDGFKREQFFFQNDARSHIWISLPPGWTHVGGPNSLTLAAPEINNAMVRLEKSALTPDVLFTGEGLDLYRRRLMADLPQGATDAKWIDEKENPLPIFGWKSHEFVVGYEFFGQAYSRAVIFIDLNATEQIVATAVAPKDSYERVHAAGMDVLRSWQVVTDK